MTTYHAPVLAILFVLLVGGPVRAQDHHVEQGVNTGVSQEAHVHGIAELRVILEGEQLDIELHSPAMNLLGFEHQASTPEQQAQVTNAKNTLINVHRLFTFGPTQCQLIDYDVDVSRVLDKHVHHDTDHHNKESHHEEHDVNHHGLYTVYRLAESSLTLSRNAYCCQTLPVSTSHSHSIIN